MLKTPDWLYSVVRRKYPRRYDKDRCRNVYQFLWFGVLGATSFNRDMKQLVEAQRKSGKNLSGVMDVAVSSAHWLEFAPAQQDKQPYPRC